MEYIDKASTRFHRHRTLVLIERTNVIHAAHVEQYILVVENSVTVASPATTRAQAKAGFSAKFHDLDTVFDISGLGDQRLCSATADEHIHTLPRQKIRRQVRNSRGYNAR